MGEMRVEELIEKMIYVDEVLVTEQPYQVLYLGNPNGIPVDVRYKYLLKRKIETISVKQDRVGISLVAATEEEIQERENARNMRRRR